MSDYGFKTEKTKGVSATAINAKWPILGFDMKKKPACFKTIRVIDAKHNNLKYSSNVHIPTNSECSRTSFILWRYGYSSDVQYMNVYSNEGLVSDGGIVEELIYQSEHNMGYKPMFYWIATGDYKSGYEERQVAHSLDGYLNTLYVGSSWTGQTNRYDSTYLKFRDYDIPKSSTGVDGTNIFPWIDTMARADGSPMNIFCSVRGNSSDFIWTGDGPDYTKITIAARLGGIISPVSTNLFPTNVMPYKVEVDDKYVKIYRRYCWIDACRRMYGYGDSTSPRDSYGDYRTRYQFGFNANWRGTTVSQTEGSVLDFTIMLMPYKMEDLL